MQRTLARGLQENPAICKSPHDKNLFSQELQSKNKKACLSNCSWRLHARRLRVVKKNAYRLMKDASCSYDQMGPASLLWIWTKKYFNAKRPIMGRAINEQRTVISPQPTLSILSYREPSLDAIQARLFDLLRTCYSQVSFEKVTVMENCPKHLTGVSFAV